MVAEMRLTNHVNTSYPPLIYTAMIQIQPGRGAAVTALQIHFFLALSFHFSLVTPCGPCGTCGPRGCASTLSDVQDVESDTRAGSLCSSSTLFALVNRYWSF